ncbi:MAG TPA: phosphoglycerate mutase family protein [Thermoanaerobaculia bacterium]|nr:phosphoglycerate mutase family protein [Thermoanaerobaculia bacterium]
MYLLALLLSLVPVPTADLTTVILVRHAEKVVSTSDDPALSERGLARASELARVLADVPIDVIYTTQFVRTRDTAAPLAKVRGITPVVVTAGKTYAADLARTIREKHAGQTVLVVGHSNSTSNLLRELGVENPPRIEETRYDDLFIYTISGNKSKLLPLRYGIQAR